VEPYHIGESLFYHLDLYRIGDPEEVEFLGLRDYLVSANAMLVEWPERAKTALPAPDLALRLEYARPGRVLTMESLNSHGTHILGRMKGDIPNMLLT
jgi:tRNA threonylcarbamoyladenosine biosynthesis protein TsaE